MLRRSIFVILFVTTLFTHSAYAQLTRFIPGVEFQLQHKGYWYYDFYPNIAFQFTNRIAAGAGWNERAGYNPSLEKFIGTQRVSGPRVFSDVYLGKGFYGHAETEWMNRMIRPNFTNDFQPRHREWVWSLQAGAKRKFAISDHFNTSVLLQYNFVNDYFRTPYADRVNFRVGVEYVFKRH